MLLIRFRDAPDASMKVPPKRKGNCRKCPPDRGFAKGLNESPSEKEGKSRAAAALLFGAVGLNESPSEKEGKPRHGFRIETLSMEPQ